MKLLILIFILLLPIRANAVPDAVCGNGKHVGNPHCTNVSPAPVPSFGETFFAATFLVLVVACSIRVKLNRSKHTL